MRRSIRSQLSRSIVAATAAFFTFARPASAGTVAFDPPALTVDQGQIATFEVGIGESSFPQFQSIDMVILMDPGDTFFLPLGFAYAQSFLDALAFGPPPPCGFIGCTPNYIGGLAQTPFTAPLRIGTLSVDTAALSPGVYDIFTSAAWELEHIGFEMSGLWWTKFEPLEGRATLTIVPEPTALLLLTVACAFIPRPRPSSLTISPF